MKKSSLIFGVLIITFFAIFAYCIFDISIQTPYLSIPIKQETFVNKIEEHSDMSMTHGDGPIECADCHIQPIIVECITCHPEPPMYIDNSTYFPHHDPEGYPQNYSHNLPINCTVCHSVHGGTPDFPACSSAVCHESWDDIRYVKAPEGNSTYCIQCHIETILSIQP